MAGPSRSIDAEDLHEPAEPHHSAGSGQTSSHVPRHEGEDEPPGTRTSAVIPADQASSSTARRGRLINGLVPIVAAALVGAVAATGANLGLDGLSDSGPEAPSPPASRSDGVGAVVNSDIPAVADAVIPSVVHVSVSGVPAEPGGFGAPQPQPGSGVGSGVIYRADGYILTNNHVVAGAQSVQVRLSSGEVLNAEVVGTDPLNDLAVLRVSADGLPPIDTRPENEPVVVGETVIAIGSPFGLEGTVTSGIVSALNRDLPVPDEQQGALQTIPSVIQTDTAINPGNSGGALVDAEGRLIGLNTAILSDTGAHQGIGFAVPAAQAIASADQVIEDGHVRHPLLGVTGRDITPTLADEFGLATSHGAIIETVDDGTAAAEAGLQPGDVIIAVDGSEISTMSELVARVREKDPGDELGLLVLRSNEEVEFTATLGELLPTDL